MFNRLLLPVCFILILWAGALRPALAVEAASIRDDSYSQLVQGELKSMALTSDGYLMPAYARSRVGDSSSEIVWDALRERSGSVLCATGHRGRLVRVTDDKTSQTIKTLPEPELTAMVRLRDGSVLIAAAPTGRIYRLGEGDKLTTYTTLKANFIWRMVQDRQGDVWAATGGEGRLYRISEANGSVKAEEIFKFKSANLLDLWIDEKGKMGEPGDLFVAGQNPGWLYRFRPTGKLVQVVYNAAAEEIRALQPTPEGLALALNTERAPTSQAISMTMRMPGGGFMTGSGGPGGPPAPPQPPTPPPTPGPGGAPGGPPPSDTRTLDSAFSSAGDQGYGPPRSEVLLLTKDGFTRRLWGSPERPIHDLATSPDGRLLAAAGNQGRLFEIWPNGEHAVVADLREDYIVRIVPDDQGYLLAAARNGLVFHMAKTRAKEATYLSRPIDAGALVKWGQFYWHGDRQSDRKALFSFRSGNDGDPESNFWSSWSDPEEAAQDQPLTLEGGPARFLQYRLTLRQDETDTRPVRMEYAEAFYVQPNGAPRVNEVTINATTPPRRSPGDSKTADGPPPPGAAPAGRDTRSNPMQFNINWRASDPNGDPLRYALYYRAQDETEWKLVDDKLTNPQMSLSVGGVADGRYRFRVVATDELGNAPGQGLTAERVSDDVIIDNTPPHVQSHAVEVNGHQAVLRLEVSDALSLIASVKADIDNGDSYPLTPVDGILDQQTEKIEWRTGDLKPGEHVSTINITDRAGNTTVEKLVFTIK